MLYVLYTFIILSLNATPIFDQEMQKAKELFDKQKYEESLNGFLELNKSMQDSNSAVLFNIGNCYFKMGKHGYAKAYYSKARSISPRDEDISYNLAYVDSVLGSPGEGYIKRAVSVFSIDEAYIMLAVFFALSCIFILLYIRGRSLLLAGVFFILFVFALLFTVVKITTEKGSAVLVVKNSLRAAPTETSTVLAELPEGVILYVKEKNDNWARVSFKDEYIGWIKKDSLMELGL
jgi:tetratricopeptide (TPR) repeat protein